jgi:hypothetical protein
MLDEPGTLLHVMVRGIEGNPCIVLDYDGRKFFVTRIGLACEKVTYFGNLVAYIQINPMRAGLLQSFDS